MDLSENTPDGGRAKRQKLDRHGRGAALEKLKQLKGKGVKHKYEVEDVDNVYDTVDEREYSKKVLERQDEDWIVDDDGAGYVEDGREIFDDDLDSESIATASKQKHKPKKSLSGISSRKSNIRSMFAKMPSQKKTTAPKLEDDDILEELLAEVNSDNGSSRTFVSKTPKSTIKPYNIFDTSEKQAAKNYIQQLSKNTDTTPAAKIKLEFPSESGHEDDFRIDSYSSQSTQSDNIKIETVESPKIEHIDVSLGDFTSADFDGDDDDCMIASVMKTEEKENVDNRDAKTRVNDYSDFKCNWESEAKIQVQDNLKTEQGQTGNLLLDDMLVENDNQEKVFRFYWLDAYEDPFKGGVVHVFGKVYNKSMASYVSCCVTVKNIERRLFILPRQFHQDLKTDTPTGKPVSMADVYQEFSEKFAKSKFRSRDVRKPYCFTVEGIPKVSNYLEVRYPPEDGRLLRSNTPAATFQHVFGTDTNFLETFLLDRSLKGPCWLDVKYPETSELSISWCKVELTCKDMRNMSETVLDNNLAAPPLVIMALNVRTTYNQAMKTNEISILSYMTHSNFPIDKTAPNPPYEQHACAITLPHLQRWNSDHTTFFDTYKGTKLKKCESERALLNYFIAVFLKIDPDLIIGHDLIGCQLDILFSRLCALKVGTWSRLGKLRRKTMPQRIRNIQIDATPGRLVCDLKISAKELIKSRSYDLGTLCMTVLKMNEDDRFDYGEEEIVHAYQVIGGLKRLVSYTMNDTELILKMVCNLNVLPLALQITNISGYIFSKTLLGGRSERNEFLLLHAFTAKDYIVPDKYTDKDAFEVANPTESTRKKPTYAGGLVLEPKVGFYENYVLLMDFNSLYPSIIQEYNICFTAMPFLDKLGEWQPATIRSKDPILPVQIQKLVESRRQVKARMKGLDSLSEEYMQCNIRQTALKLTANSMYGCLGFSKSRFFAKPLAAIITQLGRKILLVTKDLVEEMCYEVIYGDTDSLMIRIIEADYEKVLNIGQKIKNAVNKFYKQIELDIDGVFKYLLLLKKKKYAAVTISKNKKGQLVTQREIKGLDIVRRDWAQLAAETGNFILNNILSDHDSDEKVEMIHKRLMQVKEDLEKSKVPISLLVITKQLTKDPSLYPDKKNLPHVQVAIRYNSKGGRRLRQGDTVLYVICDDGKSLGPMQRAYHVDEFKNSTTLKIDEKYYLSQQVYPLVSRICAPIEYIQLDRIAELLGLNVCVKQPIETEADARIPDVDNRFMGAESFKFKCILCKEQIEMSAPFTGTTKFEMIPTLAKCSNAKCNSKPLKYIRSVENQLILTIRKYISKYYEGNLTCDDTTCNFITNHVPKNVTKKNQPSCWCGKGVMTQNYTDSDLYGQLSYFHYIFSLEKIKPRPEVDLETVKAYRHLQDVVCKYLSKSKYGTFDLIEMLGSIKIDVSDLPY